MDYRELRYVFLTPEGPMQRTVTYPDDDIPELSDHDWLEYVCGLLTARYGATDDELRELRRQSYIAHVHVAAEGSRV